MFSVWCGPASRPTVDIDLLGKIDRDKDIQWRGFIRKANLSDALETFEETVGAVKLFIEPLAAAITERKAFNRIWIAPGPWW